MRNFRFLGLLILLAAALAPLCHADSPKPILKVGFDVPLTGNCDYMGQDVRDGALLALEDSQPTKIDYKYTFEDNQLMPRPTHEAARKLLDADKVDCIVSLWANAAYLVAPLAEQKHVIHLNTGWDHVFTEKYQWSIVHGATYQKCMEQFVDYFVRHGVKRIAIAPQRTEGWVHAVAYAQELFKKAGIEVVFAEYTNPGERDFRVYLLKLKETKPDFIFFFYTSPELEIFLKQKKELGIDTPATGYTTFPPASLIYAQGMEYFSDLWVRPDFLEHFTKRFGHAPLIRAGHSYDLMKMYISEAETLYKKLGRVPTHQELLAVLKTPRDLPDLVVGPGKMAANGSIITGYKLVKIEGNKTIDIKE